MTIDFYREALEQCGEEIFKVKPREVRGSIDNGEIRRGPTLTRWDKLSIYIAVPEVNHEDASIIFDKIKHRNISKVMLTRFLRVLVKANAIHEIPNLKDMRRVSYRKRMVMD